MLKVLVVTDKHDTTVIDATDRMAAYLALFDHFDALGYYEDLKDGGGPETEPDHVKWYEAATAGAANAARNLVIERKSGGYEYEDHWNVMDVQQPSRVPTDVAEHPAWV